MRVQPVILCGGSGTRLWPLSREQYPKQLLALNGEHTLLQATVRRVTACADGDAPLAGPVIVCNEEHRFLVAEQLRGIGTAASSIILEPAGRGTAPALTLVGLHPQVDDDPVLLVLPSDHLIADQAAFQEAIGRGIALANAGHLVTFGIPPTAAETGYGYIRAGAPVDPKRSLAAHYVQSFVEKPDVAMARRYCASGHYFWNSGMFAVRASVWIECISRLRPEVLAACERAHLQGTWDDEFYRVGEAEFSQCPQDSIDYAVMERITTAPAAGSTTRAVMVPLEAGWSDVGAWSALWEVSEKDHDGNVLHGDVCAIDARGALLLAQHRFLACVGLDDVVVVETPDAVLVARRDKSQDVRQVVSHLKSSGRHEYITHRKVHRPWGSYDGVDRGERFQVKRIVVNAGASLSSQMHYHRAEHWVVVRGTARVTRGEEVFLLTENQSTYIPVGVAHRLENPGKLPLEIIEVQSGAYLGEDDIVRFEDSYGRAGHGRDALRAAPAPRGPGPGATGTAGQPAEEHA